MSSDEMTRLPTNVVKPIPSESKTAQNSHDGSASSTTVQPESKHVTSSGSSFLLPDAPAELNADLAENVDISEPLTGPFGTINKYDETVLFESVVRIVENVLDDGTLQFGIWGMVSIIFYPEMGKIRLILMRERDVLPAATAVLLGRQNFKYDGLGVIKFYRPYSILSAYRVFPNRSLYAGHGNLFGSWEGVSFVIEAEHKVFEFMRLIRDIEVRISENLLPAKVPNDPLESEFWFRSAMRKCNVKILYIHKVVVGIREEKDPVWHEQGIVALAQCKESRKCLWLVTVWGNSATSSPVDDIGKLSIASPQWSNKYIHLWEWLGYANDGNKLQACGFKTAKEAQDLRTVIKFYLYALATKQLSWDW